MLSDDIEPLGTISEHPDSARIEAKEYESTTLSLGLSQLHLAAIQAQCSNSQHPKSYLVFRKSPRDLPSLH